MNKVPVFDNTLSDRKDFPLERKYIVKDRYWNFIKSKMNLQLLVWICAALGWWGIIYPEFTLTSDTCRIVDESGSYVEMEDDYSGIELYEDILQADRNHIRPRSKILSVITALSEKQVDKEESRRQENED